MARLICLKRVGRFFCCKILREKINVYKSTVQGLREAIEYAKGNHSDAKRCQSHTGGQQSGNLICKEIQIKNSSDSHVFLLLAHLCGSDTIKNVAWIPSHFHFINTRALGCYTGRFFDIKEDFLCHSITNQNGACM